MEAEYAQYTDNSISNAIVAEQDLSKHKQHIRVLERVVSFLGLDLGHCYVKYQIGVF